MWKEIRNHINLKKLFNLKNNILLIAVVLFLGCSKTAPQQPAVPQDITSAVTSSSVPYLLAAEVLRGVAKVSVIVPPAGHAHHFEPAAQNIIDIQNAPFFFYISDRMEPWAAKFSNSKGIALGDFASVKDKDPHIWMDFDSVSLMAEAIAAKVAEVYPSSEETLAKNTAAFKKEVEMLKRLYGQSLQNCETRKVFHIGHMAFGYIAKNYNLEFLPLIGSTFEGEPSAKTLAEMVKKIKENNIKYIFTEDAVNSKLADTLAAETGAQVLKLYTIEFVTKEQFESQISYRQFMTKNLESLIKGLQCS